MIWLTRLRRVCAWAVWMLWSGESEPGDDDRAARSNGKLPYDYYKEKK